VAGLALLALLVAQCRWMVAARYPDTPRVDHVDVLHGVPVQDPYRWLEDVDSEQVHEWIAAQRALTSRSLAALPGRERIRERVEALFDYDRYGLPAERGGYYFYTVRRAGQNQPVLYRADSPTGAAVAVLDVNEFSDDGSVSLRGWAPSPDGRLLAYGLSTSGSDWHEWRIRDVETQRDLEDRLLWVKFSRAAWTHDGAGFYYSRYDPPAPGQEHRDVNTHQRLYYHRVGAAQEHDELVYERPDEPEWGFNGRVTDDGRYLVIHVSRGSLRKNGVLYRDLTRGGAPIVELLPGFEARYGFVGNEGPTFYFVTDLDAPRSRLIAIDIRRPDRDGWREIIPQRADVLQAVRFVNHRFIAICLRDAHSAVLLFDRDGRSRGELELPGIGSVAGFGGRPWDRETFFSFTSFTTPAILYRYDLGTDERSVWREPALDFEGSPYDVEQVFYESRDGTRVPMFVVRHRDRLLDGARPTYLYGYGGFGASLSPFFSPANAVWLELGGVYAQANLRGGGEYGRPWHEAGTRLKKQNVFDDFISAAEWLIEHGYTNAGRLGIGGRSNGGLLVGAAMTQRPDLFAASLPSVGVLDMLRFHKFTIGWAWTSDYGSAEDPDEFRALLAYSPYHNVAPGTAYPATLISTADHDDRVYPAHSFKFAAALQAAQAGAAPILLRVEPRAGHGAGLAATRRIAGITDHLTFLASALGVEVR
jgi:prolyl oligopeptidase